MYPERFLRPLQYTTPLSLMRNLKLIWDFRGPAATPTARHHIIHLKEYMVAEKIPYLAIDTEEINAMHTIAYVALAETHMPKVRDDLRPHRGQLYQK